MAPATEITIMVSRTVSWREGQVTRRNSEIVSPTKRKLKALRATCVLALPDAPEFLAINYLTSRWSVWIRHLGQYFFSSSRSGVLRLFFEL
jgi:hypothetical protein